MTEPTKRDREKARHLCWCELCNMDTDCSRRDAIARALAAQREEDARVAESRMERDPQPFDEMGTGWDSACRIIAAAIRNPQAKEQ